MNLPNLPKKSATPLSQFRSKDKMSQIVASKPIPIHPSAQSGIQVEQEQMSQTTSYAKDNVFSSRICTRQWKQTNQLMHDRQQMDINLTDKQENMSNSLYIEQQPESRLNKLRTFIDDILQKDEDDLLFGCQENDKPIIDKKDLNIESIQLYNEQGGLSEEDLKFVQRDQATLKSLLDEKNLSELELFNVCFDECQAFMREHKGNEAVLATLGTIKNYYVNKIVGRNARESSFDGALKVLDNRCQVLEAENRQLYVKCQELEAKVAEAQAKYEESRKQVFQHVKERESLLGTINTLQNKNSSAEKSLETFKASAAQTMAENVIMRKRIERLSMLGRGHQKEIEALRELIDNQKREIAFLAPAKARLQEELKERQQELKDLTDQLEKAKKELNSLKDFLSQNCITEQDINSGTLGNHVTECFDIIIQLQKCENQENIKQVFKKLCKTPEKLQSFVKILSSLRNAVTAIAVAQWLKKLKFTEIEGNSKATMPDDAILIQYAERPRAQSRGEKPLQSSPQVNFILENTAKLIPDKKEKNEPSEAELQLEKMTSALIKSQERAALADQAVQDLRVKLQYSKKKNDELLVEIDSLRQQLLLKTANTEHPQSVIANSQEPLIPKKAVDQYNPIQKGVWPGVQYRNGSQIKRIQELNSKVSKQIAEMLKYLPKEVQQSLGVAAIGALFRHKNRFANQKEFQTTFQAFQDVLKAKMKPENLEKATKSLLEQFLELCNDTTLENKITTETYKNDRVVFNILQAICGNLDAKSALKRSATDSKLIEDEIRTRRFMQTIARGGSARHYEKAHTKTGNYIDQQLKIQKQRQDIMRELQRSRRELETKLRISRENFMEELKKQVKDPEVLALIQKILGQEMVGTTQKLNEEIRNLQHRLARALTEIDTLSASVNSSRVASVATQRVQSTASQTRPEKQVQQQKIVETPLKVQLIHTWIQTDPISLEELRYMYEKRLNELGRTKKQKAETREPSEAMDPDDFESRQPEMTNEQLQQASKDMVQFFAAMGRAGIQDKLLPDMNITDEIKAHLLDMIERRRNLFNISIHRNPYKNKGINSIYTQPKSQYSSKSPDKMKFEGYQLLNTNITIVNNKIVENQNSASLSQSDLDDTVTSLQLQKTRGPLIQIQSKETDEHQKVFTSVIDMHPYAGESVFNSEVESGSLPIYSTQCFQLNNNLDKICAKYKKVDKKFFPALLSTFSISDKENELLQICFANEIKGEDVTSWVPGYNAIDNNFKFIRLNSLSIKSNKRVQAFKIFGLKPKFVDVGSECYYKIPLEHCMLKSEKWVLKAIMELINARIGAKFSYYVKTPQNITEFTEISHAYDKKHYESFPLFLERYLVRKYGTARLGMSLYITLLANLAYYQYGNDQIYIFIRILFDDIPLDAILLYFQIYQCVKGSMYIRTDLITNLISAIFKTWAPKKQFSYLQQILTNLYDYKHNRLPDIVNVSDIAVSFMQQTCLLRRVSWAQLQNLCNHMLKQENTIDITKKAFKQIISAYLPTYPQESIEEMFYVYSDHEKGSISKQEIYAIFCTHQLCRFGSISPELLSQILGPADLELQKGVANMLKYIRPLTQHFEELLQRRGDSNRGNALDAYVMAAKEDLKSGDAVGATTSLLQAMQVIMSVSAELEPSTTLKAVGNVSIVLKKAYLQ